MMTRRKTCGLLASAAVLSGCQTVPSPAAVPRARLLWRKGALMREASGGFGGRDFTMAAPFRVASVTKLLVAELARRLAAEGRIDLDADVAPELGTGFRHPAHPDRAVTLRRLLSHRSGITDPPVYWLAAPGDIRALITPAIWEAGATPGESFRYSNFNYGLAATVIEARTGERFDRLFDRHIAAPLGLDIGLNWSGVSRAKRASGFPGLRGQPGDWAVQVDGPDVLGARDPAVLIQDGASLSDYRPGRNGTLFSPQGGLRASVDDLLRIGRDVILAQPDLWEPSWVWDGTVREGGPSESGHFVAFGEGVYIYPAERSPVPGRRLVGHHGEAYGIHCGVWAAPDDGSVFVHADLGSPADGSPLQGGVPNLTAASADAFAWWRERL